MYKFSGARGPPTASISPSTRTPQSSTSSKHREQPQQCYTIVSGHACFERSRSKHAGRQRAPRTARGHPTPMASLKSQKHHRRAKTVVIMHLLCKSREAPSRVHGACTGMHKSSSASCLRAPRLVSGTNCNEWTQSPRRRARFPTVLHTVVVSCTLAQTQGTSTAHMIKRLPSRLAECNSQCACVLHSAVCFAPPWTARRQREPSRRVCSEFRKSKRFDPLSLQHIPRRFRGTPVPQIRV